MKEYQKEYRKNMTDEQKQRYKEARNKRNMTDEERQKKKEYQKEYRKNITDEQKQFISLFLKIEINTIRI